MLRSQLQVLLVALFSSVLLARASGAPHTDMLTELLRADLTKNNEDLTHLLLLKLMSELVDEGENEVLPELDQGSKVKGELSRRHLPLSQRERKTGCRNFFWKTFTSC